MVALNFDTASVPSDAEALPDGVYLVSIIKAQFRPYKGQKAGEYLSISLQVQDGPHKGRWIFDSLHIHHEGETARTIARKRLRSLLRGHWFGEDLRH